MNMLLTIARLLDCSVSSLVRSSNCFFYQNGRVGSTTAAFGLCLRILVLVMILKPTLVLIPLLVFMHQCHVCL